MIHTKHKKKANKDESLLAFLFDENVIYKSKTEVLLARIKSFKRIQNAKVK